MKRLASASLGYLLVLAFVPAQAGDVGESVVFGGSSRAISIAAAPAGGGVIYDSGPSSAPRRPWDTLLFHGESPDPGLDFEAGRQDPAGAWRWTSVELHRRADGRFWGRARFPRSGARLRLRAVDSGVATPHEVVIYSLDVFDSGEPTPAIAGAAPSAASPEQAVIPRPVVIGRAQWGAKPAKDPYVPHVPKHFTIHHTDGRQTRTLAESEAEVRFIQEFHQNGRGWSDIAYHFLIDAAGNIFEGRPEGVVGAHTLNHNTGYEGIAILGNYHPPKNDQPTEETLSAIVVLGKYLAGRYAIDPAGLKGHRDYNSTDCPGDIMYGRLAELRKRIAAGATAAAH